MAGCRLYRQISDFSCRNFFIGKLDGSYYGCVKPAKININARNYLFDPVDILIMVRIFPGIRLDRCFIDSMQRSRIL